ncbi:hypothetical protein OEZ86_007883 [Tetradesmus obliquus]|nr:hypothetical protein OEZ86_007883 [Tetradesmus obliquus]
MQPAAHAPPGGYGMPAAFSVRVAGGGRCSVSAVPVALFDGTAEFYVHVEHAGNGDAWLEVWGRALGDMDAAAAAALFEPSGWTRNVVKYINMLDSMPALRAYSADTIVALSAVTATPTKCQAAGYADVAAVTASQVVLA